MPFSWSLSRLAISLIGCILIGRRFSFSCAGRLRHNQSHLWTHRSFSLPGCRAVVILVARSLSIVGRPAQRTKRPADRQTEQQDERLRWSCLLLPSAGEFIFLVTPADERQHQDWKCGRHGRWVLQPKDRPS